MNRRLLALGDSYTIGEGVAPADRWPARLAMRLRQAGIAVDEPEIIARTGWTTDELAEGIARAKVSGPYDLVSLLIGVNNQYRRRDLEEYRLQFASLLTRAIAFAAGSPRHVLVLSIPDWGATPFAATRDPTRIAREIDAFNAVNRAETEAAAAHYVDITPCSRLLGPQPGMLAADGLHPSGTMYAAWVDLVLPVALTALGY
jgi:lysophospholipase L1-like esterase